MPDKLPFEIHTHRPDGRGPVQFVAIRDGVEIGIGRYALGDIERRLRLAREWASNSDLWQGLEPNVRDISSELERAEAAARASIAEQLDEQASRTGLTEPREAASFVSEAILAELVWNIRDGRADFVIYDRLTCEVNRAPVVVTANQEIRPPSGCDGIATPGWPYDGAVLLPTEYDETGLDEDRLRTDVEEFICSYVELTSDMQKLCVEYVLLSWIHDSFTELPFLAFRTADAGRGKSRALETIGFLCYRGMLCGGGSTAAGTLRLLDRYGGTLLADEFDQKDSELGSELTRIINQGFQQNRPLVRCDGDANTPKPFKCFGPKVFALRRGFADDASETRIISVTMRQRTRSDIPLCLPRSDFDRRALVLRNRLLAWRFANLGRISVDPSHADPRLEDRSNQIGLPLLAVAGTEVGRDRIVAALLEQQETIAADRSDGLPGAVFEAVLAIACVGDSVRPAAVSAELNRRQAESQGVEIERLPKTDHVSPGKVGFILKKVLELPRDRDQGGTVYRVDNDRVLQLRKRFGVAADEPQASLVNLQVLQTCQNEKLPEAETSILDSARRDSCKLASMASPQTGVAVAEEGCNEAGLVATPARFPHGWTAHSWADELDRKAEACACDHPETAKTYRLDAVRLRAC